MPERRFPPPWSVVEENAACFIVKDHGVCLFRGRTRQAIGGASPYPR
jgi:hypothetical protein